MARTDTLGHFLTDVADAIREKKGTSDTIQASDFDTEIGSIESGGKYAPRYICFYKYTGTELADEIANLDTSNMTTISNMFSNCGKLQTVDISNFDTSNVVSSIGLFQNCAKLTSVNLGNVDFSNLVNITDMFSGCQAIQSIVFPATVFKNRLTAQATFAYTTNLKTIDISGIEFSNSTCYAPFMFYSATSLQKIDMRNIDTSKFDYWNQMFGTSASNGPPDDCLIIVGTDNDKTWFSTNFPRLTNVKTVAEYEAEQNE